MSIAEWKGQASGVAAVLLLALLAGCGDDDGGPRAPTPTPTPTDVHNEAVVGSTQAGGGQLKAEYEFDEPIHAHFSACVGGFGEDCEGGIAVYTSVSPGFESLEEDEPEEDHFTLAAGTPVTSLCSRCEGLSIRMEDIVIDGAGQTLAFGAAPFHVDTEAQVAVEAGMVREEGWKVSFVLSSDSPAYATSDEYTLTYQLDDD
jgi:hypothetical protein